MLLVLPVAGWTAFLAVARLRPFCWQRQLLGGARRIIAMLRMPTGATIAAIMTVTDWQQHSVRGFLAGVVRKRLGLNLISEQTDKGRVYRIKDGKASSAPADQAKHAA